jgi:hypothetical protein
MRNTSRGEGAAMADDAVEIYIRDIAHGTGEDDPEFIRELETEYGLRFEGTSTGDGAANAAYFATLALDVWPYITLALGAFFLGKPISDNLEAWPKVVEKIGSFFKRNPTLNRAGAAILALDKIASVLGHMPHSIQLIGYRRMTLYDKWEGKEDPGYLTTIEGARRVTETSIYVFQIDADGRHFRAFVEGHDVRLLETKEPDTTHES